MAEMDKRAADAILLDALVAELQGVHGGDLAAVVLYGSSALDGAMDGYSDLNVLVLFQSLPLERLRLHSQAIESWEAAGNAPPQIMTVAEWDTSADIFPIEYSDILQGHRVLYGALPGTIERVSRQHLRLELEREAAGKLIQLRRGLLSAGGDPEEELLLLLHAFGTFMAIGRALIRLHGESPPQNHDAVARRAAELAEFEPSAFLRILEHRTGRRPVEAGELDAIVAGYVEGATQLARHADAVDR